MKDKQVCQHCSDKHQCQQMYERMGNSEAPSVFGSVIIAFVVPVVIFIVASAIFEASLADKLENSHARNGICVAGAGILAVGSMFLTGYLRKNLSDMRNFRDSKCR